ncbi:MAG: glycosyltransferase [Clostridia bacterium]|nr:glycosyltransferase [Clostridia bacterium]
MVDVSVIILNYKTPKMCIDCINSLIEHSSFFSYEIIVIDNNSQDNSREMLLEYKFSSEVKFVWNLENLGTAKAFNQGAKIAEGNYLFYLNTDTLFINNAIYEQLKVIKSNSNVAVVGGNLFSSSMNPTHSYQKNYFCLRKMRFYSSFIGVIWYKITSKIFNREFNFSKRNIYVDYVCAAATLMRKDIYLSVGGFDEDIFIYGDEALFAYNCKKNGYLSINTPKSKIVHFEGDSFEKDINNFSEARCIRYYNGISIQMKKMYGNDFVKKYYLIRIRQLRNKMKLFRLLGKRIKSDNILAEIKILRKFLSEA